MSGSQRTPPTQRRARGSTSSTGACCVPAWATRARAGAWAYPRGHVAQQVTSVTATPLPRPRRHTAAPPRPRHAFLSSSHPCFVCVSCFVGACFSARRGGLVPHTGSLTGPCAPSRAAGTSPRCAAGTPASLWNVEAPDLVPRADPGARAVVVARNEYLSRLGSPRRDGWRRSRARRRCRHGLPSENRRRLAHEFLVRRMYDALACAQIFESVQSRVL
jgi:hypothetical protein